jgi:hypothetical protein
VRRYGLNDLMSAIHSAAHPRHGVEEEARWQAHRAEVIARALGISLSEDRYTADRKEPFRGLMALLRHRTPHPLAGFLEASLLERLYGAALGPIHEIAGALNDLYADEVKDLTSRLFGEVPAVEESDLDAAGLNRDLEPDWSRIYDKL